MKDISSSLLVSIYFGIAGQRRDNVDLVFCKKRGKVFLAFFEEDNEVATVYNVLSHGPCLEQDDYVNK